MNAPQVGVVMGSSSDWEVMKHAVLMLKQLGIRYEAKVVSAHRTPDLLYDYAASAEARGIKAIIAGAEDFERAMSEDPRVARLTELAMDGECKAPDGAAR